MNKVNYCRSVGPLILLLLALPASARMVEYHLEIEQKSVNINGQQHDKLTLNGSIPGPVLEFTEGDEAVIHVTNRLDKTSSLHWHGLLLPANMDGVPGLAGFHGIAPQETFTYRFPIRQNGTYWYHAHSAGQEQDGLYGALIIRPDGHEHEHADRDYVVLLSDYHADDAGDILSNLKKSSEFYQYDRHTLGDFIRKVQSSGLKKSWQDTAQWAQMRMLPTDLSDVSGYTFLVNGGAPLEQTLLFSEGERVRLRIINGSAMTFFDVRIPGLAMTVIAADGQPVEPFRVDEFRIGVAETYDVIVEPKADQAWTFVAESIDRTGSALATLAPRNGMQGSAVEPRPRYPLTMSDMPHTDPTAAEHAAMGHEGHTTSADYVTGNPGSGWMETGAPTGTRTLTYADLRYLDTQQDVREPTRDVEVRLGGNMDRYIWTLNGKKYSQHPDPIVLQYGERVRLKFVNDTMMAHPMHLHGLFVQLENGQPMEKLPAKHTVIIAPGDTYSVLLTANEPGEWAIHCHLLFHSMTGMMAKVVIATSGSNVENLPSATGAEEPHHVH